MKKYIFPIILIISMLGGVAAYASDVSDAEYSGTLRVSNVGTEATTVSANFTLDTQTLIDFNFMDNGSDAAIVTSTGGDIPFMPGWSTNPWVVFTSTISAYSSIDYELYTGGVTGGKRRYFPGSAGMTTSDDSALEPSTNYFVLEQAGFLNTTAGADKNYAYKQGALKVSVDSATSGTINADITGGFPSVAATNYNATASGTSHSINLPSGIASGDLLLIAFGARNTSGAITITWPAGWAELSKTQKTGTGVYVAAGAIYKVADGGEGSSVTITTDVASYGMGATYRIDEDDFMDTPEAGTPATGEDTAPDPPSLTPSWGTENTFFIAFTGYGSAAVSSTCSAYPSDYDANQLNPNGNNTGVAIAARQYRAASDDPGAFTLAASNAWVANTIAVRAGNTSQYSVAATGIDSGEAALLVPLVAQLDDNLSCEDGTPPTGYNLWTNGDGAFSQSSDYALDGTYSGKFTQSAGFAGRVENTLSCTQNTTYTVTMPVRSDSTSSVGLCVSDNAFDLATGDEDTYSDAGGDWEVLQVTWTTGAGVTTLAYSLYIWGSLDNVIAYMDKISVVKGGTQPVDGDGEPYHLGISIDGTLEDSHYEPDTIIINDNAKDWAFLENDAMTYLEYQEITVAGTQQQYVDWDYAATFTDQSGNGHDATPTFRTTSSDADVSASMLNFAPTSQAQASASSLSYEGELIEDAPDEPSTMYTDLSTNEPGLFLAPLINEYLDAGEVPRSLFWYPFAYLIVIAIGALAFRITKSLLVQSVIMSAVLLFFCLEGLNILGVWTVIFFGFEAFGVIILSKHFAW